MNASKTEDNRDFVIVAMIEPQPIGSKFTMWPLHITLLPWFSAPDAQTVIKAVEEAVSNFGPITVQVGEREYFGQKGLPVMLIQKTPDLVRLHEKLLRRVQEHDWDMPGRYVGEHFKPHVTQKQGHDAEGHVSIDAVYIAEKLGQGYRQIVAKVAL